MSLASLALVRRTCIGSLRQARLEDHVKLHDGVGHDPAYLRDSSRGKKPISSFAASVCDMKCRGEAARQKWLDVGRRHWALSVHDAVPRAEYHCYAVPATNSGLTKAAFLARMAGLERQMRREPAGEAKVRSPS